MKPLSRQRGHLMTNALAAALLVVLTVAVSACGMATDGGPAASAPGISEASTTSGTAEPPETAGQPALPEEMPDDFGFVAAWGVGAKNSIDTFAGTVVKDRITEPAASGELVLSSVAMQTLYQDLRTMESTWQLFSAGLNFDPEPYSEIYPPGVTSFVTPFMTYRLDWRGGGFMSMHVDWDDGMLSPEPKAAALRTWFRMLREIVEAMPEWQALPAPVGGYL